MVSIDAYRINESLQLDYGKFNMCSLLSNEWIGTTSTHWIQQDGGKRLNSRSRSLFQGEGEYDRRGHVQFFRPFLWTMRGPTVVQRMNTKGLLPSQKVMSLQSTLVSSVGQRNSASNASCTDRTGINSISSASSHSRAAL